MAKHVVPEVVTWTCDRCDKLVDNGQFDVDVKFNVKDSVVSAKKGELFQLCDTCRHELALWWAGI